MKSFAAACCLLLLGAGHGYAQTDTTPKEKTPPAIKSIDVRKGDQWVYELRDELTDELKFTMSYAMSDLADNEIDIRVKTKAVATNAEGAYLEVFDRRWRKTEGTKFSFKKYQESWGVPDDLAVGKDWSYEYEMHVVGSVVNFKWAGHGEVVAWEKVTLPSGQSFDAFKIEYHEAISRSAGNS
jgi:hypothetical protein